MEAKGLAAILNKFETGLMVQIWSNILERFDKTSKRLQDSRLDLNTAINMLHSLKIFVQNLRSQFNEIEQKCKVPYKNNMYQQEDKRKIKQNKQWDYHDAEADDADAGLTASDKFKIHTFLPIIDKLIAALNQRISAYSVIHDRFGFLSQVTALTSSDLLAKAKHLVEIYPDDLEPQFSDKMV